MGTVSYGFESMDEVSHQLLIAFGAGDKGKASMSIPGFFSLQDPHSAQTTNLADDRCPTRDSWAKRHVFKSEGRCSVSRFVS